MATVDQEKLTKILSSTQISYQVRVLWTPLTWSIHEPNHPDYTAPVRGNGGLGIDLMQYVASWEIQEKTRQLSATLSLNLKEEIDNTTLRAIDYNDLLEVFIIITGDGETVTKQLGTFLVDRRPIDAEQEGSWTIEARDTSKLLTRRRYIGGLEPTKILQDSVTLVKLDRPNVDYVDFFYDTEGSGNIMDRAINWCNFPAPLFYNAAGVPIIPSDDGIQIVFGDGIVRMSREYYTTNIGTYGTILATFYRYAQWEDRWANPTYKLNDPTDIMQTIVGSWAGFQYSDPNGLCYMGTIEPVTYPNLFDKVAAVSDLTDYTDSASGAPDAELESAPTVELYVGSFVRRFPVIHFSLATVANHAYSSTKVFRYDYWNGTSWVEITPDLDTTDDLRQSGIVSWYEQSLAAWTKGQPVTGLPSGFYVRIRMTATVTIPTIHYIMAGYPIQCQDMRFTTSMDRKPADILDDIVRPFAPPNYRWGADRFGNFRAGFDIESIAVPDFELNDHTLIKPTSDMPHEDSLVGIVVYQGQARERFNAASPLNGGAISNLQAVPPDRYSLQCLIGGLKYTGDAAVSWVYFRPGYYLPDPGEYAFQIDLGGVASEFDLRELHFFTWDSDTSIVITPGTSGITWVDNAFGTAITDGNDVTFWAVKSDLAGTYATDHQVVSFTTPKDIKKVTLRVSDTEQRTKPIHFEVKYLGTDQYVTVLSILQTIGSTPSTVVFDNLRLRNVESIRITRKVGGSGIATPFLYDMTLYGHNSTERTGVITLSGGDGVASDLTDYDEDTGVIWSQLGTGFDIEFGSSYTIDFMELYGVQHGKMLVEYQKIGETIWREGMVVSESSLGYMDYTGLGWTNVIRVRGRIISVAQKQELSGIEVYLPKLVLSQTAYFPYYMVTPASWRIEYQDYDSGNWLVLCPEADGVTFADYQTIINKSNFGEEIFPKAIRFMLIAAGTSSDGIPCAFLQRVKVYTGDTLFGKAVLGWSYPYDTAADLALQSRWGWHSEVIEKDITATTQEAVNFRALQVLAERLFRPYQLHAGTLRFDVELGQTGKLKEYIQNRINVPYTFYLVDEILIRGDEGNSEGPTVEILILP